jgi:hypothetical protein
MTLPKADYIIKLPNTKVRFYDMMGWMLVIINLTVFCTLLYYLTSLQERGYAILGIVVTAINFGFEKIFRKPHQKATAMQSTLLYYALIWLLFFHYYIIGAASLALAVLYFIAKREMDVIVYPDRITYPSFPSKNIRWSELNNIILKDGLLTIDFKNNKIIQQLIDEKNTVDESDFNQYCREQLAAK